MPLRLRTALLASLLPLLPPPAPAATPPIFSDAARTRQFEVAQLLNARVVTTLTDNQLVTWNKGIDGTWSGLATRAAADRMGSTTRLALPDDAAFAADRAHPLVVLHCSNADATGSQVRFSDQHTADSYSFPVPEENYSTLSLFFMSAFGTTDLGITITYADTTTEVHNFAVEDWAVDVPATDTKFILSSNLAKWGRDNTELEADRHYLMGLTVRPSPAKKVVKVTVIKPASDTTLTFWGATGYLAREP